MPKDAKKNIDRYKVRGGELNEFGFHQNQHQKQEEYVAGKSLTGKQLIPTKAAKAPIAPKAVKATKTTKTTQATKGASAKKLAARKAAKKK